MKITIEEVTVRNVDLSTQKVEVVFEAIDSLFEDMADHNYDEYKKLLEKIKPLVDECCKGHGIKMKK